MFKKIRFEKSKYPIFKITFWILLVASLVMIGLIIRKNLCVFNIEKFGSTVKPITINVKFKNKINDNYFVCFDNYCKPFENNSLPDSSFERVNSYSVTFDNSDEEYIAELNQVIADFEYMNELDTWDNEYAVYVDKCYGWLKDHIMMLWD